MIGRDRGENQGAAIVYPAFEDALTDATKPRLIKGNVHDDRSIWQLQRLVAPSEAGKAATSNDGGTIIGVHLPAHDEGRDYGLQVEPPVLDNSHVVVTGTDTEDLDAKHVRPTEEGWDSEPLNVEEVELDRLFARIDPAQLDIDGPVPLNVLRDKTVAIIGLGSGGALLASYLAKSGVKNLVFLDDDVYETHNIVRHILGMDALGRQKVYATKDYLENRIPGVEVDAYDRMFTLDDANDIEFFTDLFSDVDMIISASAARTTNQVLDSFVANHDIEAPVIYAGMYKNLRGGIMIRVDHAKDDPCYHCIYSELEAEGGRAAAESDTEDDDTAEDSGPRFEKPRPKQANPNIEYDRTLEDEASEPGLGIDVDNLTIFVAKFALSNLLEDTDHDIYSFENNIYTWANRDFVAESFRQDAPQIKYNALEIGYPTEEMIPERPDCEICGPN